MQDVQNEESKMYTEGSWTRTERFIVFMKTCKGQLDSLL